MNVSPTQPRSLTQGRHVRVLGVPMDIGGAGPGASGGPQALREAGLSRMLGPADIDLGDIEVEPLDASLEIVRGSDPESRRPEWPLIRTACSTLRDKVEAIVTEGHLPLVAGGDHGLAAGSMAGVARAFREVRATRSRSDLVRRARRSQHAGDLAEWEPSWHACGGPARLRRSPV